MFVDVGDLGYQTVLVKGAQLGPHWGGAEENLCKVQCCSRCEQTPHKGRKHEHFIRCERSLQTDTAKETGTFK
jgi:hypothetical protein